MNKANDISEELKSMGSPLADMPRTMPYMVPAGYFADFPGRVQETIKDINAPELLPDFGRSLPYSVPDDYFNNLAGNIVAAATAGDAAAAFPKHIPYKAPVGYFKALPGQILSAAKAGDMPVKTNKTIPLTARPVFRQLRWAAAAVLVMGIRFGSYTAFFKSQPDTNTENILAAVPNNDIHDYLQHIYRFDVDRIVSNTEVNNLQLDNKDIEQYLNETGWD